MSGLNHCYSGESFTCHDWLFIKYRFILFSQQQIVWKTEFYSYVPSASRLTTSAIKIYPYSIDKTDLNSDLTSAQETRTVISM